MRERYLYVRENLPFSQVFAYYGLPWKQDTTHQLSCPFHGEDAHPSARYYADTKRFQCFACTEDPGGDVIWFVKKKEGFETSEQALDFIRRVFGVGMSETDLTARIKLREQLKGSLPRQIFAKSYKDRLNNLLYSMKQNPQTRDYDLSLLEKDLWKRWEDAEDSLVENYIEYCDSIRGWFSECVYTIREFLRYRKQMEQGGTR